MVTSQGDWGFRTIGKLTEETQYKILKNLDYGKSSLQVLPGYRDHKIG
ncbi:hypothetical protein PsB1_1721 [Candidatus Phycosocius spiralis]|uniref:Uncharacterized protein n=1 Tax=Candidatus Phycosocius spiralis TaxID=2815099 RepID=A0ABQ4PX17_9PROT|nr:hypothetical protein PsB1_1721 [Candidatus Phycosocius spiralis]